MGVELKRIAPVLAEFFATVFRNFARTEAERYDCACREPTECAYLELG